jgi:hypothetical protein
MPLGGEWRPGRALSRIGLPESDGADDSGPAELEAAAGYGLASNSKRTTTSSPVRSAPNIAVGAVIP